MVPRKGGGETEGEGRKTNTHSERKWKTSGFSVVKSHDSFSGELDMVFNLLD